MTLLFDGVSDLLIDLLSDSDNEVLSWDFLQTATATETLGESPALPAGIEENTSFSAASQVQETPPTPDPVEYKGPKADKIALNKARELAAADDDDTPPPVESEDNGAETDEQSAPESPSQTEDETDETAETGTDIQAAAVVTTGSVKGSCKDEVLTGGSAAERIDGGLGHDSLTGGLGNDVFIISGKNGSDDRILDFLAGSDMLELDADAFGARLIDETQPVGERYAINFRSNTTGLAESAGDRLVLNTTTGQLFFDADGNGHGSAQLIATLTFATGSGPLTVDDFLLV